MASAKYIAAIVLCAWAAAANAAGLLYRVVPTTLNFTTAGNDLSYSMAGVVGLYLGEDIYDLDGASFLNRMPPTWPQPQGLN
jgi:hypothetical protein